MTSEAVKYRRDLMIDELMESDHPLDKRALEMIREAGKRYRNLKRDKSNEENKLRRWKKDTGRNDPCPCGSGKKFKKCCNLK